MSARAHSLLAAEKTLVARFLDLLRQEQALLVCGEADSLRAVGQAKLDLVDQLNRAEAARIDFLSNEKTATMADWLKLLPTESPLREQWSDILELAREAKRLHILNGELINSHLARTSEAIAILTQRQKNEALYGSNGQTETGTGSRIVDSA